MLVEGRLRYVGNCDVVSYNNYNKVNNGPSAGITIEATRSKLAQPQQQQQQHHQHQQNHLNQHQTKCNDSLSTFLNTVGKSCSINIQSYNSNITESMSDVNNDSLVVKGKGGGLKFLPSSSFTGRNNYDKDW